MNAPKLYEACSALLDQFEQRGITTDPDHPDRVVVEQARTALANARQPMNACSDRFDEIAREQRSCDFTVVREWVFSQTEHNLPAFAHDIACMLAGAPGPLPPGYDYRLADAASVTVMRNRMCDAIAEQDATAVLAARLREDAAEEACEAAREAEDEAAYAAACDRAIPNIPCW